MKKVYDFSAKTKEFIGVSEAFIDPLETKKQGKEVYLLPANATFIEPPEAKDGFAQIWNGEAWEYIEDHRGLIVWKSYDESLTITELGAIPEGYSLERPEPPKYIPTKAELTAFVSAEADKVAYGGFTIVQGEQEYLFKTTTDNITRCNSVLAMFQVLPEGTVIPWEVWQGDVPTMLSVNAEQFKSCFAFGSQMIISVETVKGTINAEVQNLTDEQLADEEYITAFKENAVIQLNAVNTVFELVTEATEATEEA